MGPFSTHMHLHWGAGEVVDVVHVAVFAVFYAISNSRGEGPGEVPGNSPRNPHCYLLYWTMNHVPEGEIHWNLDTRHTKYIRVVHVLGITIIITSISVRLRCKTKC